MVSKAKRLQPKLGKLYITTLLQYTTKSYERSLSALELTAKSFFISRANIPFGIGNGSNGSISSGCCKVSLLVSVFKSMHLPEPALWCSGIADGLQAWRGQLAAVRLPPGPGRELWRGTQTKAQYNAATRGHAPNGARTKINAFTRLLVDQLAPNPCLLKDGCIGGLSTFTFYGRFLTASFLQDIKWASVRAWFFWLKKATDLMPLHLLSLVFLTVT